MRKLKLVLDDLEVESFRTGGRAGSKGTVLGHDYATTVVREEEEKEELEENSDMCHWTVFIYYETEYDTCGGSCGYSCPVCEA